MYKFVIEIHIHSFRILEYLYIIKYIKILQIKIRLHLLFTYMCLDGNTYIYASINKILDNRFVKIKNKN